MTSEIKGSKFSIPADGSCVTPGSCLSGERCQDALAVFINQNSQPTCTHPEVLIALEERESDKDVDKTEPV